MKFEGKKITQIIIISLVTALVLIGINYVVGDAQLNKPLEEIINKNDGVIGYELAEDYSQNKILRLVVENDEEYIDMMEETFIQYSDFLEEHFDLLILEQTSGNADQFDQLYMKVMPVLEEVAKTGEYSKLTERLQELEQSGYFSQYRIAFGKNRIYLGIEHDGQWYYFVQSVDDAELTIMNSIR